MPAEKAFLAVKGLVRSSSARNLLQKEFMETTEKKTEFVGNFTEQIGNAVEGLIFGRPEITPQPQNRGHLNVTPIRRANSALCLNQMDTNQEPHFPITMEYTPRFLVP